MKAELVEKATKLGIIIPDKATDKQVEQLIVAKEIENSKPKANVRRKRVKRTDVITFDSVVFKGSGNPMDSEEYETFEDITQIDEEGKLVADKDEDKRFYIGMQVRGLDVDDNTFKCTVYTDVDQLNFYGLRFRDTSFFFGKKVELLGMKWYENGDELPYNVGTSKTDFHTLDTTESDGLGRWFADGFRMIHE